MSATPVRDGTAERLLAPISAHLREHGLADASLRRLAAVADTSHRMLIYYFGSYAGVLGAALRAMRDEDHAEISTDVSSRRDALERAWAYFTSDARRLELNLFFNLVGTAVQQPDAHREFVDTIVATWADTLTDLGRREGLPAERAGVEARLLVACGRGLLLDRLLTGDKRGTDLAFTAMLDRVLGPAPATTTPAT